MTLTIPLDAIPTWGWVTIALVPVYVVGFFMVRYDARKPGSELNDTPALAGVMWLISPLYVLITVIGFAFDRLGKAIAGRTP